MANVEGGDNRPAAALLDGRMHARTVLLASASPRRKALVEALGHRVVVAPVDVDERELPGEAPAAYLARVVAAKASRARALQVSEPWDVTLVADTIVVVDDAILQKPADDAEGAAMLRRLSGRDHTVTTRFSLRAPGGHEHTESVTTVVTFRPIDEDEIAWYVGTGEGRDKAGGYAVQGHAAAFVARLSGSYGAVVGLPSCEVAVALRAF